MKIVITAPSLDETKNVSGISTIVRQIIKYSPHEFSHFQAGRADGAPAGAAWLAKQALLPPRFFSQIIAQRADIVHINTALTDLSIWRDMALIKAAKLAGRPAVLSIHGGKYLVNEIEDPKAAAATQSLLRAATLVVLYSDLEKETVECRWKHLPLRVLPNAVPLRDGGPAERQNVRPVMIFFGRLHESKGLEEIVKACRQLKENGFDFQFNCFGDGPMKEQFLSQMAQVLGERFHYGGVLKSSEKYAELDKADIFLLPSIYGEGLPMAILEAMAAGCLIVASEMASVAAVIEDGVNGHLIEPRNTSQLVSRLKMILDSRPEWKKMQDVAVETVRSKFAISNYIEKLEAIYRSAAE